MALPGWLMMLLGVCAHLVFLASIFDIYFKSPLVHGMEPQRPLRPAPARRLVLISADGLRADKLFAHSGHANSSLAPFINSMGREAGVWGVSHTRVPTESRPGHVAMVAGVYEDPSAVTRGWKENPVDFDTIFNRSTHTWAWGSPDIVPMLAKGAVSGRVDSYVYAADEQDFSRSRPSDLDGWVFERVWQLLARAAADKQLLEQLSTDGCVFFLHLLGLDTAGHAFKPDSSQYSDNIGYVDDSLRRTVDAFESLFNDSGTVYMFTSDHGMTDWGSHGAGDPSETETPLVLWGPGVRRRHHGAGEGGGVSAIADEPVHVQQVDLSSLMASLIGVPLPVNSMGRIPIDLLDLSPAHRADLLFTNARQLLCQYEIRRQQLQLAAGRLHWPFQQLTPNSQKQLVNSVLDYMKQQQWQHAIFLCTELIELALSGIEYYNTYDRLLLLSAVTASYIGWILLLTVHLARRWDVSVVSLASEDKMAAVTAVTVALVGFCFATLLMFVRSLPLRYTVYLYLPVLLTACVVLEWRGLAPIIGSLRHGRPLHWLLLGAGVEALVLVFFWRRLLSLLLLVLALWPWAPHGAGGQGGAASVAPAVAPPGAHRRRYLRVQWALGCFLLAYFPMSPIVTHRADYNIVTAAGVLSFLGFAAASFSSELRLLRPQLAVRESVGARAALTLQLLGVLLAPWLLHRVQLSVAAGASVPMYVHYTSWILLVLACVLPCVSSTWLLNRLLHVSVSVMAAALLLSVGGEALFCPLLALHLYTWLRLEHRPDQKQLSYISFEDPLRRRESIRPSVFGDARRAFFYLFFVVLSFFGVGNLDSINSFNPSCVLALASVFRPYLMGGLIVLKTLLPLLLVCCFAHAVCGVTRMSVESVFFSLLLMLNIMSVHFFFLVTDRGSWLDIGKSISHHVIVLVLAVFLLLLHQLARLITSCQLQLLSIRQLQLLLRRRSAVAGSAAAAAAESGSLITVGSVKYD